jgi:hypothetical protein
MVPDWVSFGHDRRLVVGPEVEQTGVDDEHGPGRDRRAAEAL